MPTNLINNSKKILSGLSLILLTGTSFAQTQSGKIWVTINDLNKASLSFNDREISSGNESVQKLISDLDIISIQQAVPASKNEELLKLYEIECNCDENDLLQSAARISDVFSKPEIAPKYETLYQPNDFSATFSYDYGLNLINAQGAWDITKGDTNVLLAISDQNFYPNHEELQGKFTYYNTANTASRTHGTAVAILAAGKSDNSIGKSSIGFNCELGLYRMNYNDVLTATYSGAKVINISWTSGCYASSYVQTIIDEVYLNGTIIVASAGNGNATCWGAGNLVYPAACNHVISVSSVGPHDNHQRTIGNPATTHQHNLMVDITAPGYDVPLSVAPGWYLTGNGTSFAAPIVTGTIGLILSVDPCLTFEQVEEILKTTAVNIDALNPQYVGLLGAGRLNAAAAVQLATTYHACGSDDDGNNGHGNDEDGFDDSNPGQGSGIGGTAGTGGSMPNSGHLNNSGTANSSSHMAVQNQQEYIQKDASTDADNNEIISVENENGEYVNSYSANSEMVINKVISFKNASIVTVDEDYIYEGNRFVKVDRNKSESINSNIAELTVYPNPINNGQTLNIRTNSDFEYLDLKNIKGETVKSTNGIDSGMQLMMDNLSEGVYFLNIHFKNGEISTEKLVVID